MRKFKIGDIVKVSNGTLLNRQGTIAFIDSDNTVLVDFAKNLYSLNEVELGILHYANNKLTNPTGYWLLTRNLVLIKEDKKHNNLNFKLKQRGE